MTIVLHGPNGYTFTYTINAGPHGGLANLIQIPGDAPLGHYIVVAKGSKAPDKVKLVGGLNVKKHPKPAKHRKHRKH